MSTMQEDILAARYFKNDERTYADVCKRVADFIGDTEEERENYYELMVNKIFLPNSPTLMNAGCPNPFMSACVVLPIEDNMESIFNTIKNAAICHQRGAGTGFSFNHLRPEGALVNSSQGKASGPVSFMTVYDKATSVVSQGGSRRGANMGILNIDHPDILKFIRCKEKEGEISNFNISVMITNDFMDKVINEKWDDVVTTQLDGYKVTVKELWDEIINHAWRNGEPGILFKDIINDDNTVPQYGDIEATNPCGEQPLLPYESCTLGSINLSKFVATTSDGNAYFRYDDFGYTVRACVRFLDSVVLKNDFPLPELEKMALETRKIGLGVMGFADALIMMGIKYDSDDARWFIDTMMEVLTYNVFGESHMLYGEELDLAFDKCKRKYSRILKSFLGFKNACLTTIAPTGTISLLADCSSGIEPVFSYVYKRKNVVGKEYMVIHPLFEKQMKEYCNGDETKFNAIVDYAYKHGSIQDCPLITDQNLKDVFRTALDISPEWHIDIQAAFQDWVMSSISKTINMPESITPKEIGNCIIRAYQKRCKGLTVYRTNSRQNVVLNLAEEEKKEETSLTNNVYERPKMLSGYTYQVQSGCCRLYVTINRDENGIKEVFVSNSGGHGGCAALLESLGRMVSLSLQSGCDIDSIIKSLSKVVCSASLKNKDAEAKSCSAVVAKCLKLEIAPKKVIERVTLPFVNQDALPYYMTRTTSSSVVYPVNTSGYTAQSESIVNCPSTHWLCPECGASNVDNGGCKTCSECGYSKCG